MTIWWLALGLTCVVAFLSAFIWLAVQLKRLQPGSGKDAKSVADLNKSFEQLAQEDIHHLFNKEFREELRNRGRLRFEKIIDENAMFLKQDLDMTIAQLNEYMKKQISAKLDEEFAAYAKAMQEAQELTLATLQRTAAEVEQQRLALTDALKHDVAEREAALLKVYEEHMAEIVEHYVLQALGDQFDLKAQLPYIIHQMETEKQNILEDMRL